MEIRKFEAPTIQEALETIKREMGPEAVILKTKKNRSGFGLLSKGSVEVTVAVSDRLLNRKKFVDQKLTDGQKEKMTAQSARSLAETYEKPFRDRVEKTASSVRENVTLSQAPRRKMTATRYIDIPNEGETTTARPRQQQVSAPVVTRAAPSTAQAPAHLVNELERLKAIVSEMQEGQATRELDMSASMTAMLRSEGIETEAAMAGFEQLMLHGVDRKIAAQIVRRATKRHEQQKGLAAGEFLDDLASEIMEATEVLSPLDGIERGRSAESTRAPVVISLIGPTGVGKTTTLVKIASDAVLNRNLRVALINIDTFKVAAKDQLATYSKILKLPCRTVSEVGELQDALNDFSYADLILIDTSGTSQKDHETVSRIQELLHSIPNNRVELVLSCTTREFDLANMAKRFSSFRPEGLIFSKLDETNQHGSVFNLSQRMKLPLLYFTTGQRVPEDMEEATQERMAALLLDLS